MKITKFDIITIYLLIYIFYNVIKIRCKNFYNLLYHKEVRIYNREYYYILVIIIKMIFYIINTKDIKNPSSITDKIIS